MNKIALTVFFGFALAISGQEPAGTTILTKKEAAALEAGAKTAADHRRVAAFHAAGAAHERAEAERHTREADSFRQNPTGDSIKRPMAYRTEAHCRLLAAKHGRAAAKSEARAAQHEKIATGLESR